MTELLVMIIGVAMIFVLVRPGSKAPQALGKIADSFASLITVITKG